MKTDPTSPIDIPIPGWSLVLTLLIFLALVWLSFRRLPRWLLWLPVLGVLVSLFPKDPFAVAAAQVLQQFLPSLLVLGIVLLGFRLIIFGGRPRYCPRCSLPYRDCRCRF